jgi:hypothetical protein
MPDHLSVFLSYAHADKVVARALAKELRNARVRVWIDEGELRAGDSIITRISEAIGEVQFVVALISKNSVSSNWCKKELSLAVNHGLRDGLVRLLPLRIDSVEIPPSLEDLLFLELRASDLPRIVRRLVKDITAHQLEIKKRWTTQRKYDLKPLSPVSSLKPTALRKLKRAMVNPKLVNARLGSASLKAAIKAKAILVEDRSIPAMETFYEASVEDFRKGQDLAYGLAGLVELAPISAPWIRRLLIHRNRHVALESLSIAVELSSLFFDTEVNSWSNNVLIDTFVEISMIGDWTALKKRLRQVVREERAALKKRYGRLRYKSELRRLPDIQKLFSRVDSIIKN